MDYKKLNNYTGWLVFLIATAVYVLTLEPTTSLWDCGEYITTAYKLEVGHPPGAPLFMMLGRLFTLFTGPESAAYMVNLMSALSSSFTILFLYWSITMIAKKITLGKDQSIFETNVMKEKISTVLSKGQMYAVLGSGIVGALAYTFTDSFWFSAVEGEVYAMSSFFTAIVVWAILKWEAEITDEEDAIFEGVKKDENEVQYISNPNRWIIFIFFMIGLSIGVHLLNLLCIPAIAYIIYFKKFKATVPGFLLAGIIGVGALGIIQAIVIPKPVEIAGNLEIFFTNTLGLPFNTGVSIFFVLIVIVIVSLLLYSRKSMNEILNTVTWSFSMILIGYFCFAMIVIRSNANPPLDENNPETLVGLESYLKREQYGDWPILYGQYYNAPQNRDASKAKDRSDVYLKAFVVQSNKGTVDEAGFTTEAEAKAYIAKSKAAGLTIQQKYYKTFDGKGLKAVYESKGMTLFPRMYSSLPRHVSGYKEWSGHSDVLNNANDKKYNSAYLKYIKNRDFDPAKAEAMNKKVTDRNGVTTYIPTFGENMSYFVNYQLNWMYWRYFMWNFSGRQSDEQGHGNVKDGNWISGLNFIDKHHIGDQTNAPSIIVDNPSHNKFYMLPLILGLIGFIFTLSKGSKSWWIIMLLFLLTGFAVIFYLSQKPMEPRERDYAYAASFYAFSFWIGLAVLGLYEAYKKMKWKELGTILGILAGIGIIFMMASYTAGIGMLYMTIVIGAAFAIMIALRQGIKDEAQSAIFATLICLPVPILMGMQGWDDHDRSNRYTAQALAENYLNSCSKNSIVYTNGDNDTFPLWYLQEVEGKKTSVRVCNLSLLNTDWYTAQMKNKAYDSEPLPISFTEREYRQYRHLDQIICSSSARVTMENLDYSAANRAMINKKIKFNPVLYKQGFKKATNELYNLLIRTKVGQTNPATVNSLVGFEQSGSFESFREFVFQLLKNGQQLQLEGAQVQEIQRIYMRFCDSFDYWPLEYAMNYLHDENNLSDFDGRDMFILPTSGFTLDIDKEKIKQMSNHEDANENIVNKEDLDKVVDRMVWKVSKGGLMKADIMILDMLANNNWDRNIYFASSAAKETYLGLDKYFHYEGLVYKLVPLQLTPGRNPNSYGAVNKDMMYKNMMEVFHWGNMEKEGVLIDYYTRRNVNNYQLQFSILADAYIEDFETMGQKLEYLKQIMTQERDTELPTDSIQTPLGVFIRGEIPAEIKRTEKEMEATRLKGVSVLDKVFEIMPKSQVPYGGITPYFANGYYALGETEKAKALSVDLLNTFEKELNYYSSLDPKFSGTLINAMLSNYRSIFSIYQTTALRGSDPEIGDMAKGILLTYNVKLNKIKFDKGVKKAYNQTLGKFMNDISGYLVEPEQPK